MKKAINFLIEEQGLPLEKALEIQDELFDRADSLANQPNMGQEEEYLEHLEKGHRRLVDGNFKIIYRVEAPYIYITDFFDTRQDPSGMKG